MLVVVFSGSNASAFKKHVPEDVDVCVISPIGDFSNLTDATDTILAADSVVFSPDGAEFNFEVLQKMKEKVLTDKRYGAVYSDYIQRVNGAKIPRLRKSFKRGRNNTKNKMLPVFGTVFGSDMAPEILTELIHCNQLSIDSYMKPIRFVPYHTPEFSFTV